MGKNYLKYIFDLYNSINQSRSSYADNIKGQYIIFFDRYMRFDRCEVVYKLLITFCCLNTNNHLRKHKISKQA